MAGVMKLSSLTDLRSENESEFNYLVEKPNVKPQKDDCPGSTKIPLRKHTSEDLSRILSWNSEEEEYGWHQNLELGIQWLTLLADNLVSHPFIVLQRQCQVFNESRKYHLTPISLIPSVINLHRGQQISTLWKGLGSCLLVQGMTVAVEDFTYKMLSWPKVITYGISFKCFVQHILLKCMSIAFVTPFHSASLVETVQSDIASEKPRILDVFRDGFQRLFCWREPKRGRIIPIWILIGPSIFIGLGKYILRLTIKCVSSYFIKRRMNGASKKDLEHIKINHMHSSEVYLNLFSAMFSKMLFYPFETILYRLQLQGTRTIIDNLDNGCSVVPILTSYKGAIDCYKTTISSEGVCGLYKGFGAVILQFVAQIAIIKLSNWSRTQFSNMACHAPVYGQQSNEKFPIGLPEMRRVHNVEDSGF